ncbi:MAG TPA: hypothetical protein VNO30_19035 [Kofleriaceae bacterium]|nr:hypothetical protein [Kofleriaceae bacterium]
MHIRTTRWVITLVLVLTGCGGSQQPPPPTGEQTQGLTEQKPVERKALSQEECEAQSGSVVGDIGNGATQRADYVCPNGKPPLGNIAPPAGGPTAVEGSVCCPR